MSTCASCGATSQPADARFCFACGASLAVPTCASCGERIVPGARFCSSCGAEQEGAPTERPVASRRVTSVLFADLVGFTPLAESRDQEQVRELLSRYFEACRAVVSRYGGTVEKFAGDAVMALWGVPAAHEDDAERAVRAGLELVSAVAAVGAGVGADLTVRVGIVTGEVAVVVGAAQQGMVAGDAVNTAARVQSVAVPGQVWVDETTRLLSSSAITYVDVGSHRLKGKSEPVPLWAVRAVVAAVGGAQRADGLEAPLVGREREMRLVKELFHQVEETGRPALLVIDGDAGVGKSRLGWEFEKYVDGLSSDVAWHSGRCLSYGEGVAFYGIAEAVRTRLQVLAGRRADDDDLAGLLAAALDVLGLPGGERDWLGPRLAALLGAGGPSTFPREDLFSAWTAFFERVSSWVAGDTGHAPVVLMVDDAQYADDGLLRYVEHLSGSGDFPCFIILLTRPGLLEAQPWLATHRRSVVIHVEALEDGDMGRLLDGLVVGLDEAERNALVRRAEGVPLFAVETVRSLIDRDLVVPRGGQYVLVEDRTVDLDQIDAPASLHALVAARLDTLAPAQRRVIDRASVAGQSFSRATLDVLCNDVADLDAVLADLTRLQLLRQVSNRLSAELGQYEFVQAVVRQVAYGTLSRRDRKAGHLRVAHALTQAGDHPGDAAAMVAQHLLLAMAAVPDDADVAELADRAVARLRDAAERASMLGMPGAAATHLAEALTRARDAEVRAEIELDLAVALVSDADFAAATQHAVAARDAWDALGDPVRAGRAAAVLGRALSEESGDFAAAIDAVEERYEALRGDPDAAAVRVALGRVLTVAHLRLGHDTGALADEQVRLAAQVDDPYALSDSYTALGLHYVSQGVEDLGRILFSSAADLSRRTHDARGLARPLNNLASSLSAEDLERSVAYARESLEAATVVGERFWIATTALNLALAQYERGAWDEALEVLPDDPLSVMSELVRIRIGSARGEAVAPVTTRDDAGEDPSVVIYADLIEALVRRANGARDAARPAVEAARSAISQFGFFEDFWICWDVATDVVADTGDQGAAAELEALVSSQGGRMPPVGVRACGERLAARLAAAGDAPAETVERHFRDALSASAAWGADVLEARIHAEYGVWLARTGRRHEAAPLLERARRAYESFGARAWLAELDGALTAVGATVGATAVGAAVPQPRR